MRLGYGRRGSGDEKVKCREDDGAMTERPDWFAIICFTAAVFLVLVTISSLYR
jgi:hypothetical protein